jgi:hypothetical protein
MLPYILKQGTGTVKTVFIAKLRTEALAAFYYKKKEKQTFLKKPNLHLRKT